jgi:hypothetical protein
MLIPTLSHIYSKMYVTQDREAICGVGRAEGFCIVYLGLSTHYSVFNSSVSSAVSLYYLCYYLYTLFDSPPLILLYL